MQPYTIFTSNLGNFITWAIIILFYCIILLPLSSYQMVIQVKVPRPRVQGNSNTSPGWMLDGLLVSTFNGWGWINSEMAQHQLRNIHHKAVLNPAAVELKFNLRFSIVSLTLRRKNQNRWWSRSIRHNRNPNWFLTDQKKLNLNKWVSSLNLNDWAEMDVDVAVL